MSWSNVLLGDVAEFRNGINSKMSSLHAAAERVFRTETKYVPNFFLSESFCVKDEAS